ncbi:MAG: B12-binding domain-containing radical SAM protein [Thermoleophilia bacterium]|nr:B12-binding domain-containing radical SAM protein [Thermoleophilia bacterium]
MAGLATMEPLGLACVAALTPRHWHIRLADEVVEEIPGDFLPDLVGITSLTPTAPRTYEIAAGFRAQGVPVVMGGMHATFCPDEAGRYVDTVVCGEAEHIWPQVLSDFESGGMRDHYEGTKADLSGLPLPRRDLYRHRYRVTLVSASRGCRNRCEFCSIWKFEGGRFRARPIPEILEELPQLPRTPITLFTDDNVMCDRDHSLELFRAMAERGLQRRHAVQASLDIAEDDEFMHVLKASGCFAILVGFESVSEATLRKMRKAVNLRVGVDQYPDRIERVHRHGLMVAGTFIFGNDGDGTDIFKRTAQFVLDAGVDLAHFGLLLPMPGTDLCDRLVQEGRLLLSDFPHDYSLLDLTHATFVPQAMTPEALEIGLAEATDAIGRWPAALRRALYTWRNTGSFGAAAISLAWTRTGLHKRVLGVR